MSFKTVETSIKLRSQLLQAVRAFVKDEGEQRAARVILDHHFHGRLDNDLIRRDNQHLFRQYRNHVSGEPEDLIAEALGE